MFDDADEEFQQLVREAFVTEAGDLLKSMTAGLQELEQAPSPARLGELVEQLHRHAHSLKGASATVGRNDIARLSLALESIFAKWKASTSTEGPEVFGLIKRAMEHLAILLQDSGAPQDPATQMAAAQLANALAALGSAA